MQVICTDFYGKAHQVDANSLIDRLSAYGVYIASGKVLLIQDPRSHRWELPGGGVERGETIRQGLVREFIEETGITPKGKFKLVTQWTEYYFDVPTNQAWRSERKFYLVPAIADGAHLLSRGNGEDSAIAKLFPLDDLRVLHATEYIRKVVEIASGLVYNYGSPAKNNSGASPGSCLGTGLTFH